MTQKLPMRRLDRWKKTLLLALAVALCEWVGAQTATILPAPVEMTMQEGYFRLADGMTICAEKDELHPVADYFAEAMKEMSGVTLKQVDTDGGWKSRNIRDLLPWERGE